MDFAKIYFVIYVFFIFRLHSPNYMQHLVILPLLNLYFMRLNLKPYELKLGQRMTLDLPERGSKEKFYLSFSSYLFRGYIEYKKLVEFHREHGYGFGLFDTLTYRNDSLPMFQGLPCFSGKDITLFMKRLRTNLGRLLGHAPVIHFLLVCEYGDEKQRPHYHPIFFVYEKISPYEFAMQIYKAWQHGKTDSVDVYGRLQFEVVNSHILYSFAAVRYIFKYILKYVEFEEKFSEVLDKLSVRYSVEDYENVRREYLFECRPFVRTSLNFGFTTQFDNEENLSIYVPVDGLGKFEEIRCPSYVYRKLFYDKVVESFVAGKPIYKRTEKGSYLYQLNELGQEFKARNLESGIKAAVDLYEKLLSPLDKFEYSVFMDYLGVRSLRDLAVYQLVYRNRIASPDMLPRKYEFAYACSSELSVFDIVFYTDFYLKCLEGKEVRNEMYFVITDKSSFSFTHFDMLLDFIDKLCKYQHVELSKLPQSVEQQVTNYNNIQYLLHYGQ